jgi:hypothetical protein
MTLVDYLRAKGYPEGRGSDHHTTIYALDKGAREIRCRCGWRVAPPDGTSMALVASEARDHAQVCRGVRPPNSAPRRSSGGVS